MAYPMYCEQPLCSGVFEPLNTLTNLFFMAAGILLFFQLKKEGKLDLNGIFTDRISTSLRIQSPSVCL
jgi:hypothetical protein